MKQQNTINKLQFIIISSFTFFISACVVIKTDGADIANEWERGAERTAEREVEFTLPDSDNVEKPKNVIMVIADGMGPAYVSAYRYFADLPETEAKEETIFDQILVGTARTYPHEVSGLVTDSAASATALAAGVKTYNGAIGMDINKNPVETVLHKARKKGMKTGLAVTSHIVHATPAAYMVANEARRNYAQIADSYFDDRINGKHLADIMLGAGWGHFIREDRNLVEEFESHGYQYIDKYSELSTISPNKPVLGLFDDNGLPWALDDTDPTRLATLTKAIVPYLENESGYFLLLEASQVDWAGHSNDVASAMAEMHDLAKTMEYLYEYTKEHPDTLVVLTADHSTGGLTIGANGDYRWSPEWIRSLQQSPASIAKALLAGADPVPYVNDKFGFELNEDETSMLLKQPDLSALNNDQSKPSEEADTSTIRRVEAVLKSILDKRTNTGWTTSGHTGLVVDVFAFGAGAGWFKGNQNNVDIADKLFILLDD